MKTQIPNKPLAFILFATRPYWWWLALITVLVITFESFAGIKATSIQKIIDLANAYTTTQASTLDQVFFWIVIYLVLLFLVAATIRIVSFILNYVTVYARTRTSKILFEYLSHHSFGYFNDRFSGSLSSRVTTVSKNISRLINQYTWSVLTALSGFVVTVLIIGSANTGVAALFILGVFILVPFNLYLTKPQAKLSEQMSKTNATLRGFIIDVITNIIAVQQYARIPHEIESMDKKIDEHRKADMKSDNYREFVLIINNFLVTLLVLGMALWSFVLWRDGLITIGVFILIITLASSFMTTLSWIGQNLNDIMESYGEVKDGLGEIIQPYEITDNPNAKSLVLNGGAIAFNNVSFRYKDSKENVFTDLSIDIKPGEKIGIVGSSGAGKTTLMKLLLREYTLNKGSIAIDNQSVQDITQDSLRESIAIVPQEPMLFHRTIKENILYGDLSATDVEMEEVVEKAQAKEFIEKLTKKYDSLVGERGVKLSVGQRQRIAIARAFLKNAPILILDEATSALDSESEVAVQTALQALMQNKTVLAIAHRLSTLREMDRILVLKDGKIIESGSHKELLEQKGSYASLWEHQAGGFLKEE